MDIAAVQQIKKCPFSFDINTMNGTTRMRDPFFQENELIQSIKIGNQEETKWRRIESKPKVTSLL